MTIYVHSANPDSWYDSLQGCLLQNVWIGATGHYHVHEAVFGYTSQELQWGFLYIDKNDAIVIY